MEATFITIGKGQVWFRAAGVILAALGLAASGRAATFGRVIPIGGQSSDLVLDEPRGVLYVSNFTAKRIEVISLSDGTRRQPITVTAQPGSIDLSPDRRYIITGHYGNFEAPLSPDNGVTLIEVATGIKRYYSLGAPVLGVGFGSDGKALAVTNKEFLLFNPVTGDSESLGLISDVNAQTLPVPVGNAEIPCL